MRWKTETGMSSFLGGGSFYVVLHLGRPLMRNLGPECSISPDCQASLRAQALPTKLLHSGALDRLVDCVDLKLRVACSKQSLLLSGPMAHMISVVRFKKEKVPRKIMKFPEPFPTISKVWEFSQNCFT